MNFPCAYLARWFSLGKYRRRWRDGDKEGDREGEEIAGCCFGKEEGVGEEEEGDAVTACWYNW